MQDATGKTFFLSEGIASLSNNQLNGLRLSEIKKFEYKKTIEYSNYICCVAILPSGNVISGSADKMLKVWDITSGACLQTFTGHSKLVSCVATLPNGNVISGSWDNTLKVWDINSGNCLQTLPAHTNRVTCISTLSEPWDNRFGNIISGSHDKTLTISNIDSNTSCPFRRAMSYSTCVALLENGKIISGHSDGRLRVGALSSEYRYFEGHIDEIHEKEIRCVIVLSNGNLISGSLDKTLKRWDTNTGACLHTFTGHSNSVLCVAVLPNGNIISGSGDDTLKVWDIDSGICLNTLEGHSEGIACIAVFPNGNIISGSYDNTLKVWVNNELQEKYQIRKVARTLAQGYRDRNCLFSHPIKLPEDILIKISSLAGNPQLHTEEESLRIAKYYFCKP